MNAELISKSFSSAQWALIKAAVDMSFDIANDTALEPLFIEDGELNVHSLQAARSTVSANIDNVIELTRIMAKLNDQA